MTTHTLLEELRRLGVQVSTPDGVTLTIDAPVGVMTPDLWGQLSLQKQDLITLLRSSSPGQDDDDPLHSFASIISHMVDALGGPLSVSIVRHETGLRLAQHVRKIRPPYQPVTLPENPRSLCPFHMMAIKHRKDGDYQVSGPCQGEPLEHGWCVDHARSHELLCLGALLGYPKVIFEHRAIGEGVAQWEGYAACVSQVHLERDIAGIRAHASQEKGPIHEETAGRSGNEIS